MAESGDKTELAVHVRETVEAIAELHAMHRAGATPFERRLERAASIVATPGCMITVTSAIVLWVLVNLAAGWLGGRPFDPYPYTLLQGVLTALTAYVSLAILTAQRRAGALADLRAQVTLEHSILAEHKAAKVIELIEELRRDAPSLRNRVDSQAHAMSTPTDPKSIAEAIAEKGAAEKRS